MSETNAHHAETKRPADEPARRTKQVYGADESRRKQSTERAKRAAAGWGRAEKYRAAHQLAGRLLEAELTQKADAFSCDTNNDPIEDERTRRGGRADESGGLVGGRGGVRTGKAQPPRGGASSEEGGRRPALSSSKKTGGSRKDAFTITT